MAQCLLGNVQLWRPGLWSRFSIRAKLSSHWALQCILGHSFIFCCPFMCTPLELKASPLEKWALACPCSSAAGEKPGHSDYMCVCKRLYSHLTESLCKKWAVQWNNFFFKSGCEYGYVWMGWILYCMCLSVWKKCLWQEVCVPAIACVWVCDCDSFHILPCVICPPHNNDHFCQINHRNFLCIFISK